MLFSSLLIKHLLPELKAYFASSKVISLRHQPELREFILVAKGSAKAHGLLFNYDSKNYHLRILPDAVIRKLDYPRAENLFTDLLETQIEDIQQIDLDRIIKIILSRFDPLWGPKEFHLYAEINANLNLVLTDSNDQIIASLKTTPSDSRSNRIIRPGIKYNLPPAPPKDNPYQHGEIDWSKLAREKPSESLRRFLLSHFMGIDPPLAEEIIYQAFLPADVTLKTLTRPQVQRLTQTLRHFFYETVPLKPSLVIDEKNQPIFVTPFDFSQIPQSRKIHFPGLNQAIHQFYHRHSEHLQFENRKRDILAGLQKKTEKNEENLDKIAAEIKEKSRFQEFKQIGDLIMIHKQEIPRGASEFELSDLYVDPPVTIKVSLNPQISPLQNAQSYYKKSQKAKSGLALLEKRKKLFSENTTKLSSLQEVVSQIQTQEELDKHKVQLAKLGIVRQEPKARAKRKKAEKKLFREFKISEEWTILVGKNNQENDLLTFKTAQPEDFWFHAFGIPGSHVVLRRESKKKQPSHNAILEAASIAAYFSKGRNSKKVEVIYTQAKYVRKPQKGKPGQALVEREKAVLVTPKLPKSDDLS